MGKCKICGLFERGNLVGEIVTPDGEIYSYCYRCEKLTRKEMLEIIKKECWVNIYNSSHLTNEEADNFALSNRKACIKVPFTEGEGLEK